MPVTSSVTSIARRQMRTSLRCIGTLLSLDSTENFKVDDFLKEVDKLPREEARLDRLRNAIKVRSSPR